MERTVPTSYKELLVLKDVRKLTWKERLKLAVFGLNVLVEVRIATQHSPGKTAHKCTVSLTELMETPPTLAEELKL